MLIMIGSAAWAIGSADKKKSTQNAILFSPAWLRFIWKLLLTFYSLSELLRRLDVAVLSKSSDCRMKVGKNEGRKTWGRRGRILCVVSQLRKCFSPHTP